MITRLTRGNAS